VTHEFGKNLMKAQEGLLNFEEDWGFEAPARKEAVPVTDLSSYRRVGYTLQKEQGLAATDLIAMSFPEQMWVVPNLLPEGLAILAGKPKTGKSWLALNLALAAASGGQFFNSELAAVKVAYLCLEDSERRLKKRLESCTACTEGFQPSDNLKFFVEWPRLKDGGLERIEDLIEDGYKLVIIDTFQHIRNDGGSYATDYKALTDLKKLADTHKATILVLHHQRKTGGEVTDAVLGSTGLTGAADTIWLLQRDEVLGANYRVLNLVGRDVEDTVFVLKMDDGIFDAIDADSPGDFEKKRRLSPEQRAVYELFQKEPDRSYSPEELAAPLSVPVNAVNKILLKLKRKGLLVQPEYGRYALPKADQADLAEEDSSQKGALPTLPTLPAVTDGVAVWDW
jgi:biotin operon repressor/archaellum biogenesis ATPase FlaH